MAHSTNRAAGASAPGSGDQPIFWQPTATFMKWANLLIVTLAIAFLLFLAIVAPEQIPTARGGGPIVLCLVALTSLFTLRRGHVFTSVLIFAFGTWAYTTAISFLLGGLNSIFIIVYPIIILVSGWLLGAPAAILFCALSVGASLGFLTAGHYALLPVRPSTSPGLQWIVQSGAFTFCCLMIIYLVKSYRERLEEVRKLNQEVQESEATLHRAQAVAHVGSWIYDIGSDKMAFSAETRRIFGIEKETVVGLRDFLSRFHPDDRVAVDRALSGLEFGRVVNHEHRILVDSQVRWCRHRAELQPGPNGGPPQCVGTVQDITELKLAETGLKHSEARQRKMVANIGDVITIIDETGVTRFASANVERLFGLRPDEIVGIDAFARIHPEDISTANKLLTSLQGRPNMGATVECRFRCKDCSYRWIQFTAVNLVHDPEIKGFLANFGDITELKSANEKLHRLAMFDALTGLPNRLNLYHQVDEFVGPAPLRLPRLALLFLDLDGFKSVNDKYGHDVGDALLIHTANTLKAAVNETDIVARLAGDEFVILLRNITDEAMVRLVASRILKKYTEPVTLHGFALHPRCTIGGALYPEHGTTRTALLKAADTAMYEAKSRGKGVFDIYCPPGPSAYDLEQPSGLAS